MLACDADHVTPAVAPTQIALDAAGNTLTEAHKQTSLIPTSWEPNWDTSVYKRKKNCKKRRDPMEPQKPVSAYALFFRDTQAAIKCRNPKASFGDISKTVASMWDTLDGETKNQYKKRTDMAKKEYLKRLAAYRARLISTVTAGFCGQSSFSVAQSESSNPTLCSGSATQASQSDYRTPSSVASYSGFDGYPQRYGNNNYYSVSSAEHQEAKYQSPVKMDATRPPGQSYEGGLVTTVPCNQTAYGAYAKMASTDSSNPNAFVTQRVDYLTRAGHGPSDAIPTYASETLYAQTPTPSRAYEAPCQAVSVQLPCNYYGASYYRPAQTALYCGNEAAKPVYAGAYGGYWTAQVASPLLAPAPQTDTSRYSVSSSSSCSSGEESLTATRNDVQAPPDAAAHPTPTPTSTTTSTSTCDRNGTFDYWANAIGYY